MGEARDVLDRVNAALAEDDLAATATCFREDAQLVMPGGVFTGRDAIISYLHGGGVSDSGVEMIQQHEVGNVAIDEYYHSGTHTGPITMPSGNILPPTGKQFRVRWCDVAVVEDGQITELRAYSDRTEFAVQIGLVPEL